MMVLIGSPCSCAKTAPSLISSLAGLFFGRVRGVVGEWSSSDGFSQCRCRTHQPIYKKRHKFCRTGQQIVVQLRGKLFAFSHF